MLHKIITFVLFMSVIFSLCFIPVNAYELQTGDITADAYYLYNFENGMVMAESNIDSLVFPSSTVKIMSACIALESKIDPDTVITVEDYMVKSVSGTRMGLESGDKLTFRDLLYAMVCRGYNDATHVIAYVVSGNIDNFVEKMNEKATSLNMRNTKYLNPTGISQNGMATTISDMAILVEYMAKNQEYVEMTSTKSYKMSEVSNCGIKNINNRSTLLSSYRGLANFNTGSGDGDCAVLYYQREGLSYVSIVLNAKAKENPDNENFAETLSKKLLSHAINDYSTKVILSKNNTIDTLPVKYSIGNEGVPLYIKDDLKLFISNEIDIKNDLTFSINLYNNELIAPISKGDVVGEILISHDGKILAKADLIVKQDIDKNDFLYIMELMQSYVLGRAFWISVGAFLLIMVAYTLYTKKHMKKMYKRGSATRQKSTKNSKLKK